MVADLSILWMHPTYTCHCAENVSCTEW